MNNAIGLKNVQVSKPDMIIYGMAVLLGLGIVVANNVEKPAYQKTAMDTYMEKMLSRMDTVGVKLAEWQAQDTRY